MELYLWFIEGLIPLIHRGTYGGSATQRPLGNDSITHKHFGVYSKRNLQDLLLFLIFLFLYVCVYTFHIIHSVQSEFLRCQPWPSIYSHDIV